MFSLVQIDSLCGARGEGESEAARRIKTQLMIEINGVGADNNKVLVLAATNLPYNLDMVSCQFIRLKTNQENADKTVAISRIGHNNNMLNIQQRLKGLNEIRILCPDLYTWQDHSTNFLVKFQI